MLKKAVSPLIALVLLCAGPAGCVPVNPPPKPLPGVTVGQTTGEALLVSNATAAPLTLLPSQLHATDPEITLAPGDSRRLEFAVTEEQNVGDTAVSEIILDDKRSSHYLRQPANDLILRARFGSGRAKEIRIAIGKCLLGQKPPPGGHPVRVDRVPSPGIPFVRLCPE
ncbi:MAG TPA: hypothetical protein VEX43_15335 [Chthoniobacterales bacterium]|nr:hypothetical protein [Chthoniobacterales bacterium]